MTITLIFVWTPFLPYLPPISENSLDWSWIVAVNQALLQNLRFGSDIVFTFGPYAGIYTFAYSPSNDTLLLLGSLVIACSQAACILLLAKNEAWWKSLLIAMIFAGFLQTRDALLYSFPLILTMAIAMSCDVSEPLADRSPLRPLFIVAQFVALSLLPLIKGTMMVIFAVTITCSIAFFLYKKQWILAVAIVVVSMLSIIGWWLVSGQPLHGLPDYFLRMLPITSGYVEAMALSDSGRFAPALQVVAYIFSAIAILLILSQTPRVKISSRVLLFATFAFCFLLSFKGAFIRHDGHSMIGSNILLISTAFALLLTTERRALLTLGLVLVLWGFVTDRFAELRPLTAARQAVTVYATAFDGIKRRLEEGNRLQSDYEERLAQIRTLHPLPRLSGTVDVYSFGQLDLIASGNLWSPRPVFQSYSAYTPSLIELNRAHLLGEGAPEHVFFRIEAIDGRLPSLEDGASWPRLIANYRVVEHRRDILQLDHLKSSNAEVQFLSETNHVLGETFELPAETDKDIYARMDIRLSPLGKVIALLYKPSELVISLHLRDGNVKKLRLLAGMASSNFMVSPLIENTSEFALLYDSPAALANKQVKSISVEAVGWSARFWEPHYAITFGKVDRAESFR